MDAVLGGAGRAGAECGLGWLLLPTLAHGSIALANSLGAGLQVVLLLLIAQRRMGGIEGRALGASLVRAGFASALMGAAVVGFQRSLPGAGLLLTGVGGAAVGGVIYVLAVILLGSEELRELPGCLQKDRLAQLHCYHLSQTNSLNCLTESIVVSTTL